MKALRRFRRCFGLPAAFTLALILSRSWTPMRPARPPRTGKPRKRRSILGRRRCRNHGGLSTGVTTPEGRERIAESNQRRAEINARKLNNSQQAVSTPNLRKLEIMDFADTLTRSAKPHKT